MQHLVIQNLLDLRVEIEALFKYLLSDKDD